MHYVYSMHIVDAGDQLPEVLARLPLLQFAIIYNIIKQFSIAYVFSYQVQVLVVFINFIELYNVGVPY